MNGRRIVSLAWKEWREIVRDRLFFALAFFVPTLLMVLFGFGLTLDVENLPFAVVDQDRSAASRDYAYRFVSSRYFDFKGQVEDVRQLDRLLADNSIRLALVIPPRFGEHLARGEPAPVQVLIDGTFPMRAQTTQGYVAAIHSAVSLDSMAQALSALRGIPLAEAQTRVQPVKLEVRYLYNQSVKSIWSLAPKLIMLIMMLSPPFLTALGVVREKESGSIFNIYASTVSPGEFLIGKLAPYVLISFINGLLLWALAIWLYGTPFKGDPLFFALALLLYVVCTTGIGLVISMLVQTQVAAMIVASIVSIIPAVLYSGMLLPLSSLAPSALAIAHALPPMYFTNIVVGSFLKGVGWGALWRDVLVLAAYALGLFGIGYLLFTKRPKS
ncbi:MAG TPA: ABC transporter permease [Rhodocyclaceae bacterium]|nr:ABC transporter permease [Rhodocyclaceae bacterium]